LITQQSPQFSTRFTLSPENNQRLAVFCGQCNEHLKLMETHYGVKIYLRGHKLLITGLKNVVEKAQDVIVKLYALTAKKIELSPKGSTCKCKIV
jgi:phosphate starvation-inducible protein PhoH and related proteins